MITSKNSWAIIQLSFKKSLKYDTFAEEEKQCTYNLTLRSVRVTTVDMEQQLVLHNQMFDCSIRYPARNALAPYYLVPCPLYNIFPHYLTNTTIFGKKKLLSIKYVF